MFDIRNAFSVFGKFPEIERVSRLAAMSDAELAVRGMNRDGVRKEILNLVDGRRC